MTPEDELKAILERTLEQAREIVGPDPQAFLNAKHLPEDAGEWAEGLDRVLSRIPDGWGRWISCERGWYPIIVALDEAIAAIYPDYEVHQVKEKFGGLRYYCEADGEEHVRELIRAAEAQAWRTCERCGSTDSTVNRNEQGWITTLCSRCRATR